MAELADALDLGSSGATRTGSIPASCTSSIIIMPFWHFIFQISFLYIQTKLYRYIIVIHFYFEYEKISCIRKRNPRSM